MAKTKFPSVIHVRYHEADGRAPEWWDVLAGGVFDVDEDDADVATYKLLDVGTVQIAKRFVPRKSLKR